MPKKIFNHIKSRKKSGVIKSEVHKSTPLNVFKSINLKFNRDIKIKEFNNGIR